VSYLYEPHLHTSFASACAEAKGSEYIRGYKELGYSGIIVTDHFFRGNTSIPRNLPWKEWVNRFYRGYEEARNEGERQGFDVFFGWEESFSEYDDYLVYGLDKDWLLQNPQSRNWTRGEQYYEVKAAGGCVVQAHPFRERYYIPKIVLSSGCVDGVEVANAGNEGQYCDALAMRYAQKMKLPYIAGSDIHDLSQLRRGEIYGVFLKEKIKTAADFVKAVCNDGITGVSISNDRCKYRGNERIGIPVEIRDKHDRVTGKNLSFMEGDDD